MRLILRGMLENGSWKEAEIETGGTLLYVRAAGPHKLPELYTTQGDKIEVVELALEAGALDGVEFVAERQIHAIALMKLKEGKLVTNTGKVHQTKEILKMKYHTVDGDEITLLQGKNFDYEVKGRIVTTKGISQYDFFAQNGLRVSFLGILKQVGTIMDVFDLFDWARDPKASLSIPFVPNAVFSMALERIVEGIEEEVELGVQELLRKAKAQGIDAVKRFANSWRKGSGIEFGLLEVSPKTAFEVLQGKFKTLEMLRNKAFDEYEEDDKIYILYRVIEVTNSFNNIAIIEAFFYNK